MPQKELTALQKIENNLFADQNSKTLIALTEDEKEILNRYKNTFTYWLEKPELRDSKIINYMMETFSISRAQAYRDLPNIKYLLGNVRTCKKEWARYQASNMALEIYEMAKDKSNIDAMNDAVSNFIKANLLNKHDMATPDWDAIPIPDFDVTGDIRVLDKDLYDPEAEKRREMLRNKYKHATIISTEN